MRATDSLDAHTLQAILTMPDSATEQIKHELLALVKRYSSESDLNIFQVLNAMHEVEEMMVIAAVNTAGEDGDG
jgi:hypothetical protein